MNWFSIAISIDSECTERRRVRKRLSEVWFIAALSSLYTCEFPAKRSRLSMLVKGGERVTRSANDYAVTQFHARLISDVINSKRETL